VGKKRLIEERQAQAIIERAAEMEHPLEQARLLAMAMRSKTGSRRH
jgi:hypothetical protein